MGENLRKRGVYKQREREIERVRREWKDGERDYVYTSAAAPKQLKTSVFMLATATTMDISSTELSNSF